MLQSKLAWTGLSAVLLLSGSMVQRSVGCIVCSSPQALYLLAEYKLVTGDTGGAMRLMQEASAVKQQREIPARAARP